MAVRTFYPQPATLTLHSAKWLVKCISLTVLLMLLATVTLFALFTESTYSSNLHMALCIR